MPSTSGIPDPEGAAILIEKANKLADTPFRIDVRELRNGVIELKRHMQELINSVQEQEREQLSRGTRIYS